jgi:predicted nucleic acid-binding protein
LELNGLHLSNRRLHLRALDILSTYPHLGFEDALTAAIVEEQDIKLLSYDTDFDTVSGVQREESATS